MTERTPAQTDTQPSAKRTTDKPSKGFTEEERGAMRERAEEVKAATRRGPRAGTADGKAPFRSVRRMEQSCPTVLDWSPAVAAGGVSQHQEE